MGHRQQRFVATTASASSLSMGAFDFITNAFKNNEYEDRFATASHILVDTKEECVVVQKEITAGTKFGDAARTYSNCPSSSKGGSLGRFQPGQMVPSSLTTTPRSAKCADPSRPNLGII